MVKDNIKQTALPALLLFSLLLVGYFTFGFLAPEKTDRVDYDVDEVFGGEVTQVIDGDTIRVRLFGEVTPVRLIGVDAPEINWSSGAETEAGHESEAECFAWRAREYLISRLADERVRLETDVTQPAYDEYDRLLAYVYFDEENINHTILREGFAKELTVGAGYQKQADFRQAHNQARALGRGLWQVCGSK